MYMLLVAVLLTACEEKTEEAQKDYIVLSGTIKNTKSDKLNINGLTNTFSTSITLIDGKFKDTLFSPEGNFMFYNSGSVMQNQEIP